MAALHLVLLYGILHVLTMLNLFWQYSASLFYCFDAFSLSICARRVEFAVVLRGWIQPPLTEALWKEHGAWSLEVSFWP